MREWLLIVGIGVCTSACGATRRDTETATAGAANAGGSGGTPNSGGSAGSSTGGGSSSGSGGTAAGGGGEAGEAGAAGSGGSVVQPPAQASLSLTIIAPNPAIAGKACNVASITRQIGDPPPTTANPGVRVVNGEENAVIVCSVSGQSSFVVNASLEHGSTAFVLDGEIQEEDGYGSAQVQVYTPETSALASTMPCLIRVDSGMLRVQPGALWATFDCPALEAAPQTACSASGVVVLENCAF